MSARPARHNAARITDGREVGRSFWAASDLVGSAEQSSGPRHARQSSASKYAAHIGRVGALAVFLLAAAALGGIRQLLPDGAKIVLVARPDEEPQAIWLTGRGADDYLIWPLQNAEVTRVLDSRASEAPRPVAPEPP